jgi:hypothetical protein
MRVIVELSILRGLLSELEKHQESDRIWLEYRGVRINKNNYILVRKNKYGRMELIPREAYIPGLIDIDELYKFLKQIIKRDKNLSKPQYGTITKEELEEELEKRLQETIKQLRDSVRIMTEEHKEDSINILKQILRLPKEKALALLKDIDSPRLVIDIKLFVRFMKIILAATPDRMYKKYIKEIERAIWVR